MQVQRIQNNNTRPMFTSKVHMDFETAEYLGKAAKRGIKELLNNGQKDVVFISLESSSCAPQEIIMNVIRKTNEKFLIGFSQQLESNGVTQIYKDATKEMIPADMNSIFYMLA